MFDPGIIYLLILILILLFVETVLIITNIACWENRLPETEEINKLYCYRSLKT